MVDSLNRLGHHRVISSHNDDGKVSELGSTGTHCGKRLVTRSIQEGDVAAVLQLDAVRTNVLGDSSGFAGDDVGFADVVQQGGLTVVYMTHHGDDRRPLYQILLAVLHGILLDFLADVSRYELYFVSELLCNQHQGLCVQPLVDGNHQSQAHAGSDNLVHRSVVHKGCKVIHGNELGNLQHALLCSLLLHFLKCLLRCQLAFLLAVLGSEVVLLTLVHAGVSLLHLLLDLFLHLFLLGLCQCRLEALVSSLAALALLVASVLALLGTILLVLLLVFARVVIRCNLVHVNLLGSVRDPLALLGLLLELGHVNLAQDLESCVALGRSRRGWSGLFHRLLYRYFRGCWLCRRLWLRLRFWRRRGSRLWFRLRNGLRFRFRRWRRLRGGFGLGLRFRSRLRRRLWRLRLLLEDGALDNGFPFRLFLLFLNLPVAGFLKDLGKLYVNLLRGLLHFQVLAKLLCHGRKEVFRHLGVRICIHAGSLLVQEVHQVLQSDVVFADNFV